MSTFDSDPQFKAWTDFVLTMQKHPESPFSEQWTLFQHLTEQRPASLGPMPAWWPTAERVTTSNIGRLSADLGFSGYPELHRWSVENRGEFWRRAIERLDIGFAHDPLEILKKNSDPEHPHWLPGAKLNIVDSCFQPPDRTTAVVSGCEGSSAVEEVTYGELEALVNRFANGLMDHGFSPGDGIALFMPMNLECVAAYLGVIRAGCFVVSIADSFAPHEIKRRLQISAANGIVTAVDFQRAGKRIPLYQKVEEAEAPRAIVIPSDRDTPLREGDLWWDDLLAADTTFRSVAANPADLTNVLFSSGTTGDPKAIPWTHLTPIKAAADGHFHNDIGPGSVVAWPTNIGWMMGPWLIYATLINRAVIALYQGAPTGRGFARFIQNAGVTMLGVVPSLVRAWRHSGSCDGTDWSLIETFSSTGEPSNRADYLWLMSRAGYQAPVIEYCGGTEIGGSYITGTVVQPASPATFSTPALGIDLVLLDDRGKEADEDADGEVFLVPPSIGLSQALLNRDHDEVYYEGCPQGPAGQTLRRHGDQLERLSRGYFRAHGRADDTMNLGGIKVSSIELETVLGHCEGISECAAVAVQPSGGGADQLVVFAVTSRPYDHDVLMRDLGKRLSADLNPLFKIHDVVVTESLPRTASNKLMRRTLRAQYTSGLESNETQS